MHKFINIRPFMQRVFDDPTTANKAAEIGQAILAARSLRLTEIAVKMRGSSDAGYKRIQRFVKQTDPREALWRLFQEQAEFVIGDPTEIERPQAWKTGYVGTLKDGKTKGFWALVLATAYRGRAIPCGLITYSSKTIATRQDSRNLNHFRAFAALKDVLGERPLVLDREFSYLELLLNLVEEQVNFVIRLNLGSHPPKFWDSDGREVTLTISPGETVAHKRVWYKGEVCVNLTGTWAKGFQEPLWVMSNLEVEQALRIYFARMKIEQSFRDLKSLLGMTKLMNKQQQIMEKMLALLFLVFAISLLVGEGLRDHLYGELIQEQEVVPMKERISGSPFRKKGKKWKRYSGLFILLKQKWSVSASEWQEIVTTAFTSFMIIVQYPVPSHV
jgi:Transposase DDE domain